MPIRVLSRQPIVNYWWSKKKKNQDIVGYFCGHHFTMFRLLESTSLEGSPEQISPPLSILLLYIHGIPYAFCIWYMVSSWHSIYFFVIQLLLRMIDFEGKKKTASESHSSASIQWMTEHLEAAPSVLWAWCGNVGLSPVIRIQNWIIAQRGFCLLQKCRIVVDDELARVY